MKPSCVCGFCRLCRKRVANARYRARLREGRIMRQRWPRRPLRGVLRRRGITDVELQTKLGVSRRSMQRWKTTGVPDVEADAIACWLGIHPAEIWPDWFDAVVIDEDVA